MKTTLLVFIAGFTLQTHAQNLFPVKLDNCNTDMFCLDCGDTKAGYAEEDFIKVLDRLNDELNLFGIRGNVKFQVLVNKKGRGCVLSHTDQSNHPVTLRIIDALNRFKKWSPAITAGKEEEKSSINLVFTISNSKISARIERVDLDAFQKSFDNPRNPEIFNKTYNYTNEHLQNYKITAWNSRNSNLPNNMNDHITIDKNGLIWLTTDGGLVTFDGKTFKNAEQDVTDKGQFFGYYALATGNDNTKWVYGKNNIYSFNDVKWTKYDSSEIGIDGAYHIINNERTGEVFFCSEEGLTICKDGKWSTLNSSKLKDLPVGKMTFAKRDSKNRIWTGSFSGTAMIDSDGHVTNFENSNTVLKGKCITSMDEDEQGNLYFSLYEFNRKDKGKVNNDEGIAVYYTNGTFKQFTTDNSGMPFNHANCVLYDKNEKVLWISTDRAGLVRFNLVDGWENYHNENSAITTSYISAMAFDQQGNLYLATRQGLVKLERK